MPISHKVVYLKHLVAYVTEALKPDDRRCYEKKLLSQALQDERKASMGCFERGILTCTKLYQSFLEPTLSLDKLSSF